MNSKCILSVIICVYNGQKTIENTLESLLQQDFKNFEAVIVNDASLDNTENIIKNFFNKYQYIKYQYIKNDSNKGLFYSRFKGVSCSSGEYITFLDSDDTLCSNMYTTLTTKAKANDSDIAICGVNRVKNGKIVTSILLNEADILEFEQNRIKVLLHKATYNSGFVWLYNKIIKKSLFLNIYNSNDLYKANIYINMGEDVLLSLYLYYHAKQITFVNEPLYNYHINLQSMVNLRRKNINNVIKSINSLGKVLKYIKLFLVEHNIYTNNKRYFNYYLQHEAASLTLKQVTLAEVKTGLLDKYLVNYFNAFGHHPSMKTLFIKMIKKSKLFKNSAIISTILFVTIITIGVIFLFDC